MKTLVVANQKGGVGKTSTLVHLAFDFLERGLKVVVIDLDTQANASYTLQSFRSGLVASELFAGIPSGTHHSRNRPMMWSTRMPPECRRMPATMLRNGA